MYMFLDWLDFRPPSTLPPSLGQLHILWYRVETGQEDQVPASRQLPSIKWTRQEARTQALLYSVPTYFPIPPCSSTFSTVIKACSSCHKCSNSARNDIFNYIVSELGSLQNMDEQIRRLMGQMLKKNLANIGGATDSLLHRLGQNWCVWPILTFCTVQFWLKCLLARKSRSPKEVNFLSVVSQHRQCLLRVRTQSCEPSHHPQFSGSWPKRLFWGMHQGSNWYVPEPPTRAGAVTQWCDMRRLLQTVVSFTWLYCVSDTCGRR